MENRQTENGAVSREPFLLKPAGKDYLWGGSRLNDEFSRNIPMQPLAETWECSTHPDGQSMVASGTYQGEILADVLKAHPQLLGSHNEKYGELPILMKLIDAKKDLSVQVHPTDQYAFEHEHGQRGKTEMWYIIDAAKDAQIVHGFHHTVTKEQLRESVENGTIEKHLQKVHVHKNDVFFIRAGTVHAIGAGVLAAEIQESSNLTYRLYDYDRIDKNGKRRELHIEKALAAADLTRSGKLRQPMRVMKYQNGCASEILCRCQYFQVERMLMNAEYVRNPATFHTDSTSFQVLLCVDGCGCLMDTKEFRLRFFKGDCIFIPAESRPFCLRGRAQMLRVKC